MVRRHNRLLVAFHVATDAILVLMANVASGLEVHRSRIEARIGKVGIGASMSGPQSFDITANIVRATFNPTPGCAVTNAAAMEIAYNGIGEKTGMVSRDVKANVLA